jgi:phage tail-like protein
MPSPTGSNLPEILTSCRFYVELSLGGSQGAIDAYFLDCKGFKRTQEIIEACEVTSQRWGKSGNAPGRVVRTKVPGNVKHNNITLRRGLTRSKALWDWFEAVQKGQWREQYRDGAISIYDQAGAVQARFIFQKAWISTYSLTDLNAGSNELEIEEVELAVETVIRDQ